MYRIVTVKDKIRVPPEKFSVNVKQAVKEAIKDKMEGLLDPKVGVVLAVTQIQEVGEGKIIPGDPGIFYQTEFKLLVFRPELHDLAVGEVIENTEFGSFVRIGPIDGLVHISQLMDDFVSFDNKNSVFLGKQTKRTLKEGDKVRARIISVSWGEQNKIGLTMRQAGLGNLVWLEEEKKKKKKG
jgi:DNA-directed RNA polymerase subunit E'